MFKVTIPLSVLGLVSLAFGILLLVTGALLLGVVLTPVASVLLLAAAFLVFRSRRKSAPAKQAAPADVPLRSRTDLSGADKAEVWLAIQTMQRHHGHSDLKGLIKSKLLGHSLDRDDCQVCGLPRFQRSYRWLEEVMNR